MANDENKLFVGHLPADISEEDLRTVFGTYGEVSNIFLMNGKISDRGNACAFVSYVRRESAEDAIAVLDGKYKIRDSPDAEFIKVNWKKQGDRSGKGSDKGGGWSGGQQGGSSWSGGGAGGQQDSWKSSSWGGSGGSQSSWSQQGPIGGGHNWGPPSQNSWASNAGSSWSSGASNGWSSGNSWQDSWGGGGKGKAGGGKSDSLGSGKGDSWAQSDWRDSSSGAKGKSAPEPSNRLFVGNLPADITEDSLRYVFGTYGTVGSVHVMAGKAKSGQSCAFIEMAATGEAEVAIATLHEKYEIRPGDGPIMVKFGNSKGGGKDRSSPY